MTSDPHILRFIARYRLDAEACVDTVSIAVVEVISPFSSHRIGLVAPGETEVTITTSQLEDEVMLLCDTNLAAEAVARGQSFLRLAPRFAEIILHDGLLPGQLAAYQSVYQISLRANSDRTGDLVGAQIELSNHDHPGSRAMPGLAGAGVLSMRIDGQNHHPKRLTYAGDLGGPVAQAWFDHLMANYAEELTSLLRSAPSQDLAFAALAGQP